MEIDRINKWDTRFLELAAFISGWSKDPSTKVGAVITDEDNRIVSMGYNGFPAGVSDDVVRYSDRSVKYKFIVHAERNAILFSHRQLIGCTLYTYPMLPCSQCAAMVIQSRIGRVVAPAVPIGDDKYSRWSEDWHLSQMMFSEAGVSVYLREPQNKETPLQVDVIV